MVQNCISMYLLFCWMYSVSNMTCSSLYLPFICASRITCSWTMDVPDVLFRFKVSFSIFSQFNFTSDHGNMCTIYDAKISIVFFPFSLSRPSTMTTTTTTQRMYFRGPFLLHFSSLPSRNVIICNIEPCNKYPLFDCDNCDKAKKIFDKPNEEAESEWTSKMSMVMENPSIVDEEIERPIFENHIGTYLRKTVLAIQMHTHTHQTWATNSTGKMLL